MKNLIRVVFLFYVFWLTGCATTTPAKEAPQNDKVTWGTRVNTLSNIQNWDLKALIAIRAKDQANSASLNWRQNKKNYSLVFFGPLGTNSYKLTGQPGNVQLENSSGKKFTAQSAEILLAQQTGWRLPVSNLFYWIRGLPVPNVAAHQQFDAYHHLTLLNQQGWTIQFLRYTSVNNIDVPSKIFLDSSGLNVKIIINQWQF